MPVDTLWPSGHVSITMSAQQTRFILTKNMSLICTPEIVRFGKNPFEKVCIDSASGAWLGAQPLLGPLQCWQIVPPLHLPNIRIPLTMISLTMTSSRWKVVRYYPQSFPVQLAQTLCTSISRSARQVITTLGRRYARDNLLAEVGSGYRSLDTSHPSSSRLLPCRRKSLATVPALPTRIVAKNGT